MRRELMDHKAKGVAVGIDALEHTLVPIYRLVRTAAGRPYHLEDVALGLPGYFHPGSCHCLYRCALCVLCGEYPTYGW